MVQASPFAGVLNYDDPDEVIPSVHHKDALNIVFKGTLPNLRAENTPGTRELVNPFLINDGANLTIGRFYDSVKKRIFFFNYRPDNKKAIYMFDTVAQIFYRIAEEGINASAGALEFTAANPIIHVNMIYGDAVQGDILYYLNSFGVPKKINIDRALAAGYGTIIPQYLDVAKQPSDTPPYVAYENDPANTINNVRKKLFRFKIRWVFDDQDKSVTSSQSEMPLPLNAFDQSIDTDPTKNCRIAVVYKTGSSNVKKIEILVSNSLGVTMSDWYLVTSLDKSVEGIPDNDIATFLFYNDRAYTNIDIEESIQLFDLVPIKAGAQIVLNGNVLDYGNITEGYANLTNFGDGTNTSSISNSSVPYYYGIYYGLLASNINGITSNDIHIAVRGIMIIGDVYTIYFDDASNISYTVLSGDDSAAVIEGLRVNAIADGFTIISSSANDLYIFKLGVGLLRSIITNSAYSVNSALNTSFNAYDWNSKYAFGLVYFDAKGRTNGVVYTNGFSVQSNSYTESSPTGDITKFNASIYHQPPDWSYYYQWVRTKNLSKSGFVQWISDRTFKDITTVSGLIKYAYISIESLRQFGINNPGSPLGYSFTTGDRIRFFKRDNPDGTTANLYGATKDFEIIGSIIGPTINGDTKSGQFIKIILPATDGAFDFGSTGFDNYFIELYTPAQAVANNLNVYYEYGEKYAIFNPTLSGRVHQGGLQDQIYLSQPATFEFYKGDDYVRLRSIQTGNVYTWDIPTTNANGFRFLVPLNFISSTFTDANVTPHSVAYAGVGNAFNPTTDNRWFQSASLITTFKVGGSFSVTFPTARAGDSWRLRVQNRFGDSSTLAVFDASNAGTYTFPLTLFNNPDGSITDTVTLENDHIFLLFECINNNSDRQCTFLATNLTLTVDHVIAQRCIDPNFSDYFSSSVNSNGRAFDYEPNANQVTYPVMHRWSLAFQRDTNINQTCRFYSQNSDELVREYGAIKRMMFWDKVLTFFQERKCGQTGVYKKFITDTSGNQQLITSTDIITENNVQYYAGDFGVGNQPDSVVQSGFVYYFADPVKGKQCRLSRDGITDLSETYKTMAWSTQNISKYLKDYTYIYGGISRITGTFNIRKDNVGEYLCVLQPGTIPGVAVLGQTMAFDETRNSFTSIYSFPPECISCAENTLYSWRNGKMYAHDQNGAGAMNRFYGVSFDSTITRSFNSGLIEKKSWMSITEIANSIWVCPTIYTNYMSYGNTPQQSNLVNEDFADIESTYSAPFWGDLNSIGGILGDVLKGNLIVIKFRATNPNSLSTLTSVNLYFIDSPFTNR